MEYPNGIYLYGKLNKEITVKEYEGFTTDTSTTSVIDSTIKVDVIKVPNKLTIKEAEDLFQTFDGSKEVVVDLTPYAKEVQLLDSVELVSTSSDQNKLIFKDKSGNEITSVDISGFTQIQADWNQEDTTSEAYIKNKPTKLSQFENDGNGTSPFATEAYVEENGGKIDSISLNDVNLPIDSNKNVNIKAVEPLEGTHLVYTENGTNQTTGVTYTSSKDPNTIPIRDSDGNIEVGAITDTSSLDLATNKGYVDSQDNKKLDKTGGIIEGTLNVKENLNVTGNLNVSGTATAVKTQSLLVIDNVIATNADKQELTTLLSGLALNKNANETYGLMYDPADNTVKFGQGTLSDTGVFTFNAGEGKPLAIRAQSTELNKDHLIKWDPTTNSFVDSGKSIGDLLVLKEPPAVQTEFVMVQKASDGTVKQAQETGVFTPQTQYDTFLPVLRGLQGQLRGQTAPLAQQNDLDLINRGELTEKLNDKLSTSNIGQGLSFSDNKINANIVKIQDSTSKEFTPDTNGAVTISNGSRDNFGLFKSNYAEGIQSPNGVLGIWPANKEDINKRTNSFNGTLYPDGPMRPIVYNAINFAVKAALTDDKRIGTETTDPTAFSDTEKDRACEILGATRYAMKVTIL